MKKRIKLIEADRKVFMTRKEEQLKKRLIALLKDDGKGHHHAKYAARLAEFDINIVPIKRDPMFTAGISFDEGIIYIGEGFLVDPSTFFQLNVLLRHELAHNLLMHQIRMMHKIGDNPYSHIRYSQSLHDLLNIIEDFEISNKKYSAEDKAIVKNMWLNGEVIGGLITEEHRQAWDKLSVEQMYDELTNEIEEIKKAILNKWAPNLNDKDFITRRILQTASMYTNKNSPCQIRMTPDKFINSKVLKRLPDIIQNILHDIYNNIMLDKEIQYTPTDLENYKDQIASSSAVEQVTLKTPDGSKIITELFTPEEKQLAMELLKNILMYTNQYQEWYEKVSGVLDNKKYTDDNLKEILTALSDQEV